MPVLSLVPLALLALFSVWFVWPMVADPIARRRSRRTQSDADRVAEGLFADWARYGQGTGLLIHVERG